MSYHFRTLQNKTRLQLMSFQAVSHLDCITAHSITRRTSTTLHSIQLNFSTSLRPISIQIDSQHNSTSTQFATLQTAPLLDYDSFRLIPSHLKSRLHSIQFHHMSRLQDTSPQQFALHLSSSTL